MQTQLEKIKQYLSTSIQQGSTSHAYVFASTAELEVQATAHWFAQQLLCSEGQPGVACGVCQPCETVLKGHCPDLVMVDTDKQILSVEVVREQINRVASITPIGRYKVFVVIGADRMNVQAQNALLKTLEEAPPWVKIILLAKNKHAFLPTISSRVMAIDFVAEAVTVDSALVDYVNHFLVELEKQSLAGVFRFSEKLVEQKDTIQPLLQMMQRFYRDQMVLKTTGNSHYLELPMADSNGGLSSLSLSKLITKYESVSFCIDALGKNAHFQLAIETMLLNIRQAA